MSAVERTPPLTLVHGMEWAAEGLSDMTGADIRAVEPRLEIIPLARATEVAGAPDEVRVGIYLGVSGESEATPAAEPGEVPVAHVLVVLTPDGARALVGLLLGSDGEEPIEIDALALSALGEIGNVMGSRFAAVLGERIGCTLWATPPSVQVEMAGALVDALAAASAGAGDTDCVLYLSTRFLVGAEPVAPSTGTAGAAAGFPGEPADVPGGLFLVVPEDARLAAMFRAAATGDLA